MDHSMNHTMNHSSKQWLSAFVLIATFVLSNQALAGSSVYTSAFSSVAVSGYDTVAYFTENKAVKGDKSFSTEHRGAKWYFSSQENLSKFEQEPEKYAPQYGGYCAWAAAHNKTAKGDPEQWAVVNGKLYLNYNANVRKKWLADKENLIVKADANWPTLVD